MVWGCIGYNGVGRLEIISETMDSLAYVRTLATHLHASSEILGLGSNFIFQQDNAPCHKSKMTNNSSMKTELKCLIDLHSPQI